MVLSQGNVELLLHLATYLRNPLTDWQNGMDGSDEKVMCCFSGKWVSKKEAVEMRIVFPNHPDEIQVLYAEKGAFSELVICSIPLHPDFFD